LSDPLTASPIAGDDTIAYWRLPRFWLGILLVYWLSLFIGTHWPNEVPALAGGVLDKVAHFSAFFGLSLLLAGTARLYGWTLTPRILLVLWLVIATYGAIDELLQSPVGRSCELNDWLADFVGSGVGLLVFKKLAGKTPDLTAA